MDTTDIKGPSYENVQNNAKINEGYEVPMENEYAEIDAQAKNTEYDYTKEQNIPIQAFNRNTSTEPSTNQPNETLQHKTSQPSWFKRHKIMFAVILSVVLTALVSAVVFLTVLVVMKSDGDSCKYR